MGISTALAAPRTARPDPSGIDKNLYICMSNRDTGGAPVAIRLTLTSLIHPDPPQLPQYAIVPSSTYDAAAVPELVKEARRRVPGFSSLAYKNIAAWTSDSPIPGFAPTTPHQPNIADSAAVVDKFNDFAGTIIRGGCDPRWREPGAQYY